MTYNDVTATLQVIGNIYQHPSLIDQNEKYKFNQEDFVVDLHKVVFESIYNLHALGAKEINTNTIEDYLSGKPKHLAIYKANHGQEWLEKLSDSTQSAAFDYYYNRMKKMTLLRCYQKAGLDLSWLYDIDNVIDIKKKQKQEQWLDSTDINDIADLIDKKFAEIRLKYAANVQNDFIQAGQNIMDLLERLKKNPEVGYPLFGSLVNGIHRGARLKKFYLRSAATGVGKTRAMIADACNIACDEIYDLKEGKWIKNGTMESVVYITTEQDQEEVQTMMLAFVSAVNEDHIITGSYAYGEWERVARAAEVLDRTKLQIKKLPDFSLQDIENTIKFAIHEWNCQYVFFDYIHTSMKILSEISSRAGIKGLREDNVLFMISVRLKDLCNQYEVFIMSSTQLNSDYLTAAQYDQNLLRGAKSIADKIDCGMIMLQTNKEDENALKNILLQNGLEMPEIKISVYKNRRGKYKDILLWCRALRGICRIQPMFATDYRYQLVDIEDLKVNVE